MLLKTDFTIALIAELSGVKKTLVSNLKRQLDKTNIKNIIEKYKNVDVKNQLKKVEKGNAIALELLKIATLSDEVIARITNLKVKNILILRKQMKKRK